MRKYDGMRIMSKDIETLKERIIALVDGCNLPYVIPMLSDLENAIHEHSFDSGYDDVLEIPLIGDSLILIKPLHQVQKTAQYSGVTLYCKVFSKECHPSNNEWVVWTGTKFY